MEFYTHKGQKLLYEGMEIVSTARLPYGGMKQVTENTGKFEACVTPLLRNIRRYFSHSYILVQNDWSRPLYSS